MGISSENVGQTWHNKNVSGDSIKILSVSGGFVRYINLSGTGAGTEGRMTTIDFERKYKSSK